MVSRFVKLMLGGALALASPLISGNSDPSARFETRVLAAHNRERSAMGVPPLRWNADLALSARQWADRLADTGAFHHAPENRFAPQGENLWAGTIGYYSYEAMVDAWVREKRFFQPGVFPYNSITGRVADVARTVAFLASDEAGYLTGLSVTVAGGYYMD